MPLFFVIEKGLRSIETTKFLKIDNDKILNYLSAKAQVNRYLLTVICLKSTNYFKANTLKLLLYYLILTSQY
jgi:hypothetical protein